MKTPIIIPLILVGILASMASAQIAPNNIVVVGSPKTIWYTNNTVMGSFAETVTNVIYADNQKGCEFCETLRKAALTGRVPAIYHPPHTFVSYEPATEKWIITNVFRRVIVWYPITTDGLMATNTNVFALFSTTNRFKLKTFWESE